MSLEFVEESHGDLRLSDVVTGALRRIGLRLVGLQPVGVAEALAPMTAIVANAATEFLQAWLPEISDLALVARERIERGLAGDAEHPAKSPLAGDSLPDETATLACRLLGVGDVGRAFDALLHEVGLQPPERDIVVCRALVTSLRGLCKCVGTQHEKFGWLPARFEYLFELVTDWPFLRTSARVDLTSTEFRADARQYATVTDFVFGTLHDPLLPILGRINSGPMHGKPAELSTWLDVLGSDVGLKWFEARLAWPSGLSADDRVPVAARQLMDQLLAWQQHGQGDASGVARVAAPVFERLMASATDLSAEAHERFSAHRFQPDGSAVVRMWFAKAAYDGNAAAIAPSATQRWLQIVKQEMAAFRPVFVAADAGLQRDDWQERVLEFLRLERRQPPPGTAIEIWPLAERQRIAKLTNDDSLLIASERFERDREHFLACSDQVFKRDGVWEGMRQLLMALRSLRAPAVASDLRYWDEPAHPAAHYPRQPEEPWRCIPAALVAGFHAHVGAAQQSDPELKALRGQFAAWCLQGLHDKESKTRERAATGYQRSNDDMVDPSPAWRYARARAVRTLGVDPGGRGHRTLKVASEIDPDPKVREIANDAYQTLRRGRGLPPDTSPRRAVLGAFWWLRQAHLIDVDPNQKIDAEGAQRTRRKELDRTKEPTTE